MEDLRLGVLGFGLRGSLAKLAHRPGAGAVVSVIADPDPARRQRANEVLPDAQTVDDHRKVLTDDSVDAVLVLTPDHTHADLDITVERCDAILRTAHETGSRLYVGHNMRHMPVIRTMRDIIAGGAIGEVKTVWVRHFVGYGGDFYFKDWHAEREFSTGLLLQKAAHDIDVVHWLASGYTARVQAFGDLMVYGDNQDRRAPGEPKTADWYTHDGHWPPAAQQGLNPVIDVEDVSVVNMRLDNGVIAAYQQCHFTPDYWRNYTVIGDAGCTVKVWNSGRSGYRAAADITYQVPERPDSGGHGGADNALLDEFFRFVRDGGRTDTSPVAARMSVAAGVQATLSLRDGGSPRDVPALDPELVAYFGDGQRR